MKNQKSTTENIILAGRNIPYTLTYTNRKTISLSVSLTGLSVKAPLLCPKSQIIRSIKSRTHWILAHLDAMSEKEELLSRNNPDEKLSPSQKLALEKQYRRLAKECLSQRVNYYANQMQVTYSGIRIAEQKTRWGSCSSRGTLSFHWKLILAPPIVLDYVVLHEVCHLLYMNHSPAFWQQVAQFMPDYQKQRSWLKQHGLELSLTYHPIS